MVDDPEDPEAAMGERAGNVGPDIGVGEEDDGQNGQNGRDAPPGGLQDEKDEQAANGQVIGGGIAHGIGYVLVVEENVERGCSGQQGEKNIVERELILG